MWRHLAHPTQQIQQKQSYAQTKALSLPLHTLLLFARILSLCLSASTASNAALN